jgi:hypothetical protein
MERSSSVARILGAARDWGRRRYGQEVTTSCCAEPVYEPGGAMIAEIQVTPAGTPGAMTAVSKSVICIVTLDREGRISCVPTDELL